MAVDAAEIDGKDPSGGRAVAAHVVDVVFVGLLCAQLQYLLLLLQHFLLQSK